MAYALPLKSDFVRDHSAVLGASVLAHLALLVLLGLKLDWWPQREPQPVRLAIQASVVDSRAARQRVAEEQRREKLVQQAAERRREEQRREQERRAADERRKAEQQRQEKVAAEQRREQTDKARQAKAEQQRKESEARKQAAEAQRKAEADAKLKADADARRKAEAERREAQTRADLARQIAEEEDLLAAADSGQLDQYAEVIRQKVERNWIRPASAREGIDCVVQVKQIPGGDVVDVQVTQCNGDAAVVRSIEAAVLRSSPLPPPPDPKLFDRSLRFEFRPRD